MCRFDACTSIKPRFNHGQRAGRPRNQLDDDGVDERCDVQCAQKAATLGHCPAQQNPAAPQQVKKQHGFRENMRSRNSTVVQAQTRLLSFVPRTPSNAPEASRKSRERRIKQFSRERRRRNSSLVMDVAQIHGQNGRLDCVAKRNLVYLRGISHRYGPIVSKFVEGYEEVPVLR